MESSCGALYTASKGVLKVCALRTVLTVGKIRVDLLFPLSL